MYHKVSDHVALVRDTGSNAIINTDSHGYNSYINTRNRLSTQKSQITGLEDQVSILTTELSNIKKILETLIVK